MPFRNQLSWNLFCTFSVLGIWARFIEPRFLQVTHHTVTLPHWPRKLEGLRIAQVSDAHFHSEIRPVFLRRIQKKLEKFSPDLVLFTGDLLCQGQIFERDRLLEWMKNLPSRYGVFAIAGNHDYSSYIAVDDKGEYAPLTPSEMSSWQSVIRLFRRTPKIRKAWNINLGSLQPNPEMVSLMDQAGWTFLHNGNTTIQIDQTPLTLVGLGEYSSGHFDPSAAFAGCHGDTPLLVMTHNPDSLQLLEQTPGTLHFAGHTHGAQVNLPGFRKRILRMETPAWSRGWVRQGDKQMYVNRGIGSTLMLRVAARPELSFFTLRNHEDH